MQISMWELLLFILSGVIMTLISVFVGAFITFRSKTVEPGTGFLTGKAPAGEIFTIPTEGQEDEIPPEISARTKMFNSIFGDANAKTQN